MCWINVVFPAPMNPVRIVTGTSINGSGSGSGSVGDGDITGGDVIICKNRGSRCSVELRF